MLEAIQVFYIGEQKSCQKTTNTIEDRWAEPSLKLMYSLNIGRRWEFPK